MTDSKITTRLRPDVDRRLRAAAMLQRARISQVLNDALDTALPSLREIDGWLMRQPDTLRSRRNCRPRSRPVSGTRAGWSLHVRCGLGRESSGAAVDRGARHRACHRVMVPRMQAVAAPPTQTVPSGSAVISMVAARPMRVPWETR